MQKLTPLEIQKQTFSRSFKGYTVDEVRGFLHLVAEEIERLLKENDKLVREQTLLRDEIAQFLDREQILKQTMLSAQQISEDVKANARREAELIVKDGELLSDRLVSHAMNRIADLERTIQELKLERITARARLRSTIELFQQMITLDAEQEATELPITHLHRKTHEKA